MMEYTKETRNNKVLQRQVSKFETLVQKNKKSTHFGVYNIFRSSLPKAEHPYCRRLKI